ncbi:ABC transporter ATP-binding protein [Clostridium sp. CF012]|uniref:ABC transporter ATP-binding protein n=1 Tax=Clostridium sp. CF012 TaxID=2843319 RepID=UPI001C0DDF82|nr:ATP-binding cassette domain-containing protein [Clostridium sp. CF012]MBU3145781.1 ATP-binding cassette domain-containing protein [Clostridium sp. CF012]
MEEILNIVDLSKFYKDKLALNKVNLTFYKGEMVAIIGESGSGKTTLAKIIIGLEKLDIGEILYSGIRLKSLKKREFTICADIQYIFQDPYSSLEDCHSLRLELEEPIRICKRHKRDFISIDRALSLVDLNLLPLLDKKICTLSGGQRQKVAIARALIPNPKIIIADECTSMLDEESSTDIFKSFNNIRINQGTTLITIVHNIDFFNGYWDRILVIKNGEIEDDESFKDFYINAKSEYSKDLIKGYKFLRRIN